jgi:HPt (histidine-containing phosphotransfer) domain-containing protein
MAHKGRSLMAKPVELDIPGALRRVGGDRELLARVIDFVVEDSPQLMQRIVAALDAERFREVERAAHSLNGLVSNVHCIAVQEKVLEVEDLARRGDREKIATVLEPLGELIDRMMAKLDDARRELGSH